MDHLRLLLLLIGTVLGGYLLLCLVAPTELSFDWPCDCEVRVESPPHAVDFPMWSMEVTEEDTGLRSTWVLRGRWGEHRMVRETSEHSGDCVGRLSWQSLRWPFFLRGAAALANVRQVARQSAKQWCPPQSRREAD